MADCTLSDMTSLVSIFEQHTSIVQHAHLMAVSAPLAASSRAVIASVLESEEDLSYEEIRRLLQQAENRLRANAVAPDTKNRPIQSTMPKLDVGNISQPYMKSNGGICRVDSTCLVEKDVRNLADQPKKAKLLSAEKKKLAEVCHHSVSVFCILAESVISNSTYRYYLA